MAISKLVKKAADKVKAVAKKVVPVAKKVGSFVVSSIKEAASGTSRVSNNTAGLFGSAGSGGSTTSTGNTYASVKAPSTASSPTSTTSSSFKITSPTAKTGNLLTGSRSRSSSPTSLAPTWWGNPIQAPRTVSATSGASTQRTTSFVPTTMGADTLMGASSLSSASSSGGSSAGGSGAPSAISIPSKPTPSDPGTVDPSRNAAAASPYYNFDAASGQFVEKQDENKNEYSEILNIINDAAPKRESVFDDPAIKKQKREIRDIKAELNGYTAQLNSIVAKQNQDLLQLRQTGSQEGVTEAVYGGQALQINREAAIKALPIQASIEAAQGNLELAQEYLTELTAIRKEEIDIEYEYKKDKYNAIKDYVKEKEKRKYDELIKKADREYQEKTKAEDIRAELLKSAYAQGAPQSVKNGINKANTVNDMIAAAGAYGGDMLAMEIKREQLAKIKAETEALKIPAISESAAQRYTPALNVVLGSGKFTKEQKADVVRAVNSGDDPITVIKNQAKNIMGQTLATSLDKYETAKAQIDNIDTLLDEYYSKGGTTSLLSGKYETVLNKLGTVKDPELVSIATNISSALQIYRNAVSGTAYSVQEGQDIAAIFPGINKSEGLNKAIIEGRKQAFETTIDQSYRNTLGKSYDELKAFEQNPLEINFEAAIERRNVNNPVGI